MADQPTPPKSLDEALLALQADLPVLVKDRSGQVGNQKTRYADLVQANAVILPRLNALGLVWKTKPTLRDEDPKFVLAYELKHVPSGESEEGFYPLKLADNPQQLGSAITYARRYALMCVTGIVSEDEDDDGQSAAGGRYAQRATRSGGRPAAAQAGEGRAVQRAQRSQAGGPPLPGETAGISPAQSKMLHSLLNKTGRGDREAGLGYLTEVAGRELTSSRDLTKAEATTAIDKLLAEAPDGGGSQ